MPLKLEEFSDRELLSILLDVSDDDGWATSAEVAEAIRGLDAKHPAQNVGIRFGWLRRFGVVEYDRIEHRWRMTPAGLTVIGRKLSDREEQALGRFGDDALVQVIRHCTSTYRRSHYATANLARREWQWGVSPLRRR
jgi:hypothetical protein